MSYGAMLGAFALNWLLLFVACYLIVEFAQKYLYDETAKGMALRVLLGSLVLAVALTWTRSSFDTMFTANFLWTFLQAVLWVVVFTFVFQFQPLHGAVLGVLGMVILAGMATLAVDSFQSSGKPRPEFRTPSKPIRRPSGGVTTPRPATKGAASETAKTPAK